MGGAATSAVTVNASNTAQPVFTVNTGIDGNKALVIVFKARISPTQAAGVYTNSFTFEYEGKVMSTGALAPCIAVVAHTPNSMSACAHFSPSTSTIRSAYEMPG